MQPEVHLLGAPPGSRPLPAGARSGSPRDAALLPRCRGGGSRRRGRTAAAAAARRGGGAAAPLGQRAEAAGSPAPRPAPAAAEPRCSALGAAAPERPCQRGDKPQPAPGQCIM